MAKATLAFIIPISGDGGLDIGYPLPPGFAGRPDNSLPGFGGPVDPGYGRPGFGPGHPSQGLPWGPGHPDQGLPGYGHPDQGLPGSGGHPGHALPVPPVKPDQPIVLPPPPRVDNSLPGSPGMPDQSLPPGAGTPSHPIVVPPDSVAPGLPAHPIHLPTSLPPGSTLVIPLHGASLPQPKGVPAGSTPAIAWQGPGSKPVLVFIEPQGTPK